MHLLERSDGKKWSFWTKTGRLASDTFSTKVLDFFDKFEATVAFERYFEKKTANRWSERRVFQ